MELTKKDLVLIILSSLIFILVYSSHFQNPYPSHIDEWQNIEQALRLKKGEIIYGVSGLEIGFRIFLLFISYFTDLVLIYKYLPALWAVFSSLVLFYVVSKKTSYLKENESFFIATMAMVFFASLKSNVNLLGLWFFTPLTFSIPFLFLYIFFFTEGIEKNNKKMMFYSFLLMILVLISHAPSLLFSVPFLFIFCIIKMRQIKKLYRNYLYFLLIPLIGILFYNVIMKQPLFSLANLPRELIFKSGWGVFEVNNSIFEIYSLAGCLLTILGLVFIFYYKKINTYLVYMLWPLSTLISIFIYKISTFSFLSPYQRNFYYLGLSLPILSSLGSYFLILLTKNFIRKINIKDKYKKILQNVIIGIIIITIIILAFFSYFSIPDKIGLYQLIDKDTYSSVKFLSDFPRTKDSIIIAPIEISSVIFSISGYNSLATVFFRGNSTTLYNFFNKYNCKEKNDLISEYNASYVLSKKQINCNWTTVYSYNNIAIYEVKNLRTNIIRV